MIKKGEPIEHLQVETISATGKCIAHSEGKVIFLTGCAPGDVVTAKPIKIKPQYVEALTTDIEVASPHRITPFCTHFGMCGGCSWQHLRYEEQLKYKQRQVSDHLSRIGHVTYPPISPIIPSPNQTHYRNKLDFTFTSNRWEHSPPLQKENGRDGLGYHVPRRYDRVFDVHTCHLQPDPSNAIRLHVKEVAQRENIPFFNLKTQTGFLRTLTIRTVSSGETMVILQVTYERIPWIKKLFHSLAHKFPSITSLQYVINGKKNDTFMDLDVICWQGSHHLTEYIDKPKKDGRLSFRIGPKSFFQTNIRQAQKLYEKIWELSRLTGQEIIYDLYTGTGTIALYLAAEASHVVGIDYVRETIDDACTNAITNKIDNVSFLVGDIKNTFTPAWVRQHGHPNVVIIDPPRSGMHPNVCRTLIELKSPLVVYVSCNPATQARDLQILSSQYEITHVQPIDMFPHTNHVENVALLEWRVKTQS